MIVYHPGKANVVADALSCRVMIDLRAMFTHLSLFNDGGLLVDLHVKPTWVDQIRGKKFSDESLILRFRQVEVGETSNFGLNNDRVLSFRGQICVPNNMELKQSIPQEAHSSPYAMHPGGNKMYRDLRELYWWPDLKLIRDHLKVLKFRRKGKLSPRFIGPYHILKCIRPVTYQLVLPLELGRIHDVFHVSMFRRYRSDPSHIIPVKEIDVRSDLTFEEEPIQILDRDIKVLRRKTIPLIKVL
ncbi:integrase [Gossypium australe]|uniref:Integrase n=1 Tax=Gossypium australe TaxID=47621 RepID=A0A5B6VNE9_9ROSI|nr:integrase [Gossypium australe]